MCQGLILFYTKFEFSMNTEYKLYKEGCFFFLLPCSGSFYNLSVSFRSPPPGRNFQAILINLMDTHCNVSSIFRPLSGSEEVSHLSPVPMSKYPCLDEEFLWPFEDKLYYIRPGLSEFSHPFINPNYINNKPLPVMLCVVELKIIEVSKVIREKPEWWLKYKNAEITSKWKNEFLEENVKKDVIDYAIAELEYYDLLRSRTNGKFIVGPHDTICYSDNVVTKDLKAEFKEEAIRLENVPETMRDWHPDFNNQVLDLVDPSLYPYMYEITPILPEGENVGLDSQYTGTAKATPAPEFDIELSTIKDHIEGYGVSKRFQWLPSVFNVSQDGKVTIDSYINNLHPKLHKDLYGVIARIFEDLIPGINHTLSEYASPQRIRVDPLVKNNGLNAIHEPEIDEEIDPVDAALRAYEATLNEFLPAPLRIEWEGLPTDRVDYDIRGRKLKVITKLTNIVLTPENPDYDGKSWNVEGRINEDIVCTAIYYYDSENVTTSQLAFRTLFANPHYHPNGYIDDFRIGAFFGVDEGQILEFPVGSVECIEDRVIVFPNMMQNCMAPFSLADKTRPGHCKMMCFFVVDPNNDKVMATDRVPPQQSEWWVMDILEKETYLTSKLPPELINHVFDLVDWPMTFKMAKNIRLDVLDEVNDSDMKEYINPFSRTFTFFEEELD